MTGDHRGAGNLAKALIAPRPGRGTLPQSARAVQRCDSPPKRHLCQGRGASWAGQDVECTAGGGEGAGPPGQRLGPGHTRLWPPNEKHRWLATYPSSLGIVQGLARASASRNWSKLRTHSPDGRRAVRRSSCRSRACSYVSRRLGELREGFERLLKVLHGLAVCRAAGPSPQPAGSMSRPSPIPRRAWRGVPGGPPPWPTAPRRVLQGPRQGGRAGRTAVPARDCCRPPRVSGHA